MIVSTKRLMPCNPAGSPPIKKSRSEEPAEICLNTVLISGVISYMDGPDLECFIKTFSKNREYILVAVNNNGLALQYASQELKGDRGVVMAAVSQNSQALKYASKELKDDPELVRIAQALRFAPLPR